MQSQTTGERVKALLQARNLTQASAAELIGISDSTLGRIINDRSNGISSTTLQLMCKALHCTAADILGDQPDPPPAPDAASFAMDTLRRSYEDRMLAMAESHLDELDRLQKSHDKHLSDVKTERNVWRMLSFLLMALIITWFIWDITHPSAGLIQYDTAGRIIGFLG